MWDALLKLLPYLGLIGTIAGVLGYVAKIRSDTIGDYKEKTITSQNTYIQTLERERDAAIIQRDHYKQQSETFQAAAQGSPQLIELTAQVKNLAETIVKFIQSKG